MTGSTSGIGLGITRGFPEAGADVAINGFGKAEAIERERADLDGLGAGAVVYDGAEMSTPDEIMAMVDPDHSSSPGAGGVAARLSVAPVARFRSAMTALVVDGTVSVVGASPMRSRRPSEGAVGEAGEALLLGIARR